MRSSPQPSYGGTELAKCGVRNIKRYSAHKVNCVAKLTLLSKGRAHATMWYSLQPTGDL